MNKKIIMLLVSVSLVVSLTSCKSKDPLMKLSKEKLIQAIKNQDTQLSDTKVRVEELETLLRGVQEEDGPTAAISTINDGTGRLTFNSIKGKIIFPIPFEYPGSTQAPNSSSINITSTISIVPTSNWISKLNGTTLEIEHNSGVSGIIKAGYIESIYDRTKLQTEVMSTFFSGFPPEKITYSKLFLNDQWWGMEGKTPTTIDSQPAYARAGMLGLGDQCFTYIFLYKGSQDPSKDEVIVSLLKTIKMLGQELRIE